MHSTLDALILAVCAQGLPYLLTGKFITQSTDEVLLLGTVLTTGASLARVMAACSVDAFVDSVLLVSLGSVAFTILAILFGAPLLDLLPRTWLWALFLSSITLVNIAYLGDSRDARGRALVRILRQERLKELKEAQASAACIGACVGAWLGALFIPLDWDEPWQAWPIPLYHGAFFGWLVATLIASVVFRNKELAAHAQ